MSNNSRMNRLLPDPVPDELMRDIQDNCCVLFLGAGISTEGTYHNRTFFEYIKESCEYPESSSTASFPDVMQYYCEKMDGGRKNRLVREIAYWIERFTAEGEPNRFATAFYREIARVPYFQTFVTTNWDPFCERVMNILLPMVEDRDIPFWEDKKRQVLKIHGCITRPQTIVATRADYDTLMNDRTRGALFTKLRDLMATKAFVFVGYSISDPDFQQIYDEAISNLGDFRRGSWVVDPSTDAKRTDEWKARGIRIIPAKGMAFAYQLTERLESAGLIISSSQIEHFSTQLDRIIRIHHQTVSKQETAGGMASSMYQDGLSHSIEEITVGARAGTSLVDFRSKLSDYEKRLQQERDAKTPRAVEIAYWAGRVEPLKALTSGEMGDIRTYLHPYKLEPTNTPVGFGG